MSTSTKFLKVVAAKQSAFGTPGASGYFQMPFTGEYEDLEEEHMAAYDQGTWTPTAIVEKVGEMARLTLSGVMFFEMMPILLNASHDAITATDATTHYSYDDAVSPSAVGAPAFYTFWLGGNEAIGATGPTVRIQDAFCESWTLTGNINTKEVQMTSTWMGLQVDDNSGAGFAWPTAALPAGLGMMKTLLGGLDYQDAATTGGDFTTMTAAAGVLLNWGLTFNGGLRPKWAADSDALTYAGVRHEEPSCEYTPTLRTNTTTYAAVKGKANARTFQEVMISLSGGDQRDMNFKMTGRFQPNFIAHARSENEVVMTPTFRCETPYTQTTTPHWVSWELDTEWEH